MFHPWSVCKTRCPQHPNSLHQWQGEAVHLPQGERSISLKLFTLFLGRFSSPLPVKNTNLDRIKLDKLAGSHTKKQLTDNPFNLRNFPWPPHFEISLYCKWPCTVVAVHGGRLGAWQLDWGPRGPWFSCYRLVSKITCSWLRCHPLSLRKVCCAFCSVLSISTLLCFSV